MKCIKNGQSIVPMAILKNDIASWKKLKKILLPMTREKVFRRLKKGQRMKRLAVMIFICISVTALCTCGKNHMISEEDHMAKVRVSGGNIEDLKANSEGEVLSKPDWAIAYLSYLDAMEKAANGYTYSLIYVDEDDIPELFMESECEAVGCKILTFHDGFLDEWQSSRLMVTYIEKENLICNSNGLMGCYYDYVFTIRDGRWCLVEGGEWGYEWPAPEMIYVYQWNGTEVSGEEYKMRLNEVYPQERKKYPEKNYILKEMLSVLNTGDVTSAGHHYELVVEDLTWEGAQISCWKKGGYLATITSWEELERIQAQIVSEKKSNITFFVGANNKNYGGGFGYHWGEYKIVCGHILRFCDDLLHGFWLEGEPSHRGITESGEEIDEDCVALFYRESDNRCYLNDVPEDILLAAPSYSGRVGYICEYEQ